MRYYYAPMEGITGYIQRNACHAFFPGIDKYFTAFIAPNQRGHFSTREKNDILPEHNKGIYLVPQILTNNAEDFILTVRKLAQYGYGEVNLNLGCPSKTVVSKYRGSGFLAKPEELDHFLEEIFSKTEIKISIKTRIGRDEPEEWEHLMEIYNKYPLEELIVHPRTQKDFYKNTPNLDVFEKVLEKSRCPVCYNGDLFSRREFLDWKEHFPQVDTVMIGRGLLMNPGLVGLIENGMMPDKETLFAFHNQIYEAYQREMCGDKNVLFKMKELWIYMIRIFTNSKKYAKRIKKAEKLTAYEDAVNDLFKEQELMEDGEEDSETVYTSE
ncbi:MAG: tRNA-dihydrouridine synthase family protein [Lachnoclostridium sp.]